MTVEPVAQSLPFFLPILPPSGSHVPQASLELLMLLPPPPRAGVTVHATYPACPNLCLFLGSPYKPHLTHEAWEMT